MKITFIGDIMLARMVGSKYAQQPYKIVSDEIVDNIVHSSDLIIANLESPLPDNHETEDHLQFDGNVAALNELKWIDLFSLANNHINDCGEQGMIDTINHLEEKEFGHNGLFVHEYKPFIYQKDEEKIAVITLTDMMNIPFSNDSKFKVLRLGDDHIIDIIRQQKEKGNAVVLFAHVGMLFTRYPNPITRSFLHEYIDAGADCIVTCHSHCLGGMEYYKGKPIFHSIGDFVMDGNSYRRRQSCFLCLSMEKSTVVDWSITPTIINKRLETIIPKKRIERNMRNSFQFISTMLERYGEKESYLRLFKKKYKREIFFHSISTINFILNDRGVFGLFRLLFKRSSEVSRTMKWMSKDRSNDQRDDEAILPDRKKMKQEELFKEDRFEIGKAKISITSPNDTEAKIGKNIDNEYLVKSPGGGDFCC